MIETTDPALKRLYMRSMRRGTKEMDILLMRFADDYLLDLSAQELALYEQLLDEDDQTLYQWISGALPMPDRYATLEHRLKPHAVREK